MNLETFVHHLHFDVDQLYPSDWEVNWADAPLPYKLYRGQLEIPLSGHLPLTLLSREAPVEPNLATIGHFLWLAYGLGQLSQTFLPSTQPPMFHHAYRRFPPSGGALYPSELYVYLKMDEIPSGVYHYNAAHHRLVLLREGNFDAYLGRSLIHPCDISRCFGALFVSTVFWKNFFKYNQFAYRLQGMDAGAAIGQALEVAERFGLETTVCFQFLDRAVHHLLGLEESQENVYAVLPLSTHPTTTWFHPLATEDRPEICDGDLCRELEPLQTAQFIKSRTILPYPSLLEMQRASGLASHGQAPTIRWPVGAVPSDHDGAARWKLPPAECPSYDLLAVCRRRYSPGMDFAWCPLDARKLSSLLWNAASTSYKTDIYHPDGRLPSGFEWYAVVHGVKGVPDGAYAYGAEPHVLTLIAPGDHRLFLQQSMTMHTVNLSEVPICLHLGGDRHHWIRELGVRGYRIQQMVAGMLTQRLLLSAAALGMNGHPLLGFDSAACDHLYQLGSRGQTSLVQIPVGHTRAGTRWTGSLHS
nr:SagB family peptide dehydrogenase [Alicyclobacillus contaminans]